MGYSETSSMVSSALVFSTWTDLCTKLRGCHYTLSRIAGLHELTSSACFLYKIIHTLVSACLAKDYLYSWNGFYLYATFTATK